MRFDSLNYKAWNSIAKRMSREFNIREIQRGIFIDGTFPFDLSKCDILICTGFTDFNNKKIFEGDIVEFPLYFVEDVVRAKRISEKFNKSVSVKPIDHACDIVLIEGNTPTMSTEEGKSLFINQEKITQSKLIVIGNMFENTELL